MSTRRTLLRNPVAAGLALAAALAPAAAQAKPGTHAPAVSTWDTRASDVVFHGTVGSFDGGHLDFLSYNANFVATSGKLSSQFGLHYANYREGSGLPTLHGVSGSAVALFSFPLSDRYDDGVPGSALAFYLGSVPTMLVSGKQNFFTIPLTLGVGVPLSPANAITITPWGEVAPSINLDTVYKGYSIDAAQAVKYVDPQTGQITFGASDVQQIVADAVEIEVKATVGFRAGILAGLHVSDSLDLQAGGMLSTLQVATDATATEKKTVTLLAAQVGLVWRWDDIVPAVLPASRRLGGESCEAVEERFKACPAYDQMLRQSAPPPQGPPGFQGPPQQGPAQPPFAPAPPPSFAPPAPPPPMPPGGAFPAMPGSALPSHAAGRLSLL